MDFDVTPTTRVVANSNFMWFDNTSSLQQLVYQRHIAQSIGTDLSLGVEYRPFLNNNVITRFGVATLLPERGFKDLYGNIQNDVNPLFASFVDVVLTY